MGMMVYIIVGHDSDETPKDRSMCSVLQNVLPRLHQNAAAELVELRNSCQDCFTVAQKLLQIAYLPFGWKKGGCENELCCQCAGRCLVWASDLD